MERVSYFNHAMSFISISREILLALPKAFNHNCFFSPLSYGLSSHQPQFCLHRHLSVHTHTACTDTLYFTRISGQNKGFIRGWNTLQTSYSVPQGTGHMSNHGPDHPNSLLWHFWQHKPTLKHISVHTICPRRSRNNWALQESFVSYCFFHVILPKLLNY